MNATSSSIEEMELYSQQPRRGPPFPDWPSEPHRDSYLVVGSEQDDAITFLEGNWGEWDNPPPGIFRIEDEDDIGFRQVDLDALDALLSSGDFEGILPGEFNVLFETIVSGDYGITHAGG